MVFSFKKDNLATFCLNMDGRDSSRESTIFFFFFFFFELCAACTLCTRTGENVLSHVCVFIVFHRHDRLLIFVLFGPCLCSHIFI